MAVERSLDQSRAYAADSATAGAQYGFLVKTRNCINCNNCVEACRMWNRTPEAGPARRKITAYTDSIGRVRYVSTACMHCEDPACLAVCPAGAISKGEGGIVTVNKDRCIGCKYCAQACPFDAPHYYGDGMDKCDCCLGNGVPLGEKPHCVTACPTGALRYGTLEELAKLGGGRAVRLEASTRPAFFTL
ncbi:MAG: 4Fe-4S dicluster domain-containing protein [Eggerthellaceae bacterium]|nr:4Fe-4S dicluster domain-containing protein [Eggerthellaceae bacterium]